MVNLSITTKSNQFVGNKYRASNFLKEQINRVDSCLTHCSKKSEQQTLSGVPENRCSSCIEKILENETTGEISFGLNTCTVHIVRIFEQIT